VYKKVQDEQTHKERNMKSKTVVTDDLKEKMKDLHRNGVSNYRIAKDLGIGSGTVSYHLRRAAKGKAKLRNVSSMEAEQKSATQGTKINDKKLLDLVSQLLSLRSQN
jgi:IS30 family transposase